MRDNKQKNDLIKKTPLKNRLLLYIAIVCVVALALYARVSRNNYVDLDDTTLILDNYPFLQNFSNVPQAFNQGVFQVQGKQDTEKTYYRPIMTLSFMVDAHISPPADLEHIYAKPFLKANIFYHMLACVLLLLFLYALDISPISSLILTLLFAVHPILLQAVSWIPGRNDSLVTIFILASMLMLLKFDKSGKIAHLVWHFFFFVVALFTKENAVVLPLITFIYFYTADKEPVKKKYALLAGGYVAIGISWFFMRQHALINNSSGGSVGDAIKNLFTNSPMFFQYIGKSVIPYGLSVMSTVQDTNYIIGILAIAFIVAGIILSKEKKWGLVIVGLFWFLAFLAPSFLTLFSGLEHRDYLPLVGLIIVASQFDVIKKLQLRFTPPVNAITLVAMVAILITFAGITYSRQPVFQNAFSFDEDAIKTSPHSVLPCLYLAKHYEQINDFEKAIEAYNIALQREPNGYMLHNSIGGDYIGLNKTAEAAAEFKKELDAHPDNKYALFNLGLYNLSNGNDSVAIAYGKKALAVDKEFVNGYKLLATVYRHKGDSVHAAPYIKWLKEKGIEMPTQ